MNSEKTNKTPLIDFKGPSRIINSINDRTPRRFFAPTSSFEHIFNHNSKFSSQMPQSQANPHEPDYSHLESFFHVHLKKDLQLADDLNDSYPLLELRRSILRMKCAISEFFEIIVRSALFQVTVILVVLANSIELCLEDPKWVSMPYPFNVFELFFLIFYTVEFAMIVMALGLFLNSDSYFRSWWNLLDFTILVTAWLSAFAGSGFRLSSLRSLRILRPLRSITSIKGMKVLFMALVNSIKPLFSAIFVLFFFIFIFSVAAVQLWMSELKGRCLLIETGVIRNTDYACGDSTCGIGEECVMTLENPNFGVSHYDNILISLITVFQIITLEGWTSNLVITETAYSYWSVLYFMPLVFVTGTLIMNFCMAIIAITFKHASIEIWAEEKDKQKYEEVSQHMFDKVYKHAFKEVIMEDKPGIMQVDSGELTISEQKKEDGVKLIKEIKFNTAISDNAKSTSVVQDNFEVENDSKMLYRESDDLEAMLFIDLNHRDTDQVYHKVKPIVYKRETAQDRKIIKPQFNLLGGDKTKKADLNEPKIVINDCFQDKLKKLKSFITLKNSTISYLKQNPGKFKRVVISLRQNFKTYSNSVKNLLNTKRTKIPETFTFSYRNPEDQDPLHISHLNKIKKLNKKFSEFPSSFSLFSYFLLKYPKKQAFFLVSINSKSFILEKKQLFPNDLHDWSGYNINFYSSANQYSKPMSSLSFTIWSSSKLAFLQKWQYILKCLISHKHSNNLMLLSVLVNTLVLSLERYQISNNEENILQQINVFFTYLFASEIFLKFLALGPVQFARDLMNIFDATVVVLSLCELFLLSSGSNTLTAFRAVRIFRVFRVLRVLRIFRYLKPMTMIINSISKSFWNIIYLFLLLALFQVIFTLLGMQVFGGNFNTLQGVPRGNFDSFHWAFVTTYQVLSMENWNDVLTSSLRSSSGPASCLLLVTWIVIGNFILLNLFLAIILDSFGAEDEEENLNSNKSANSKLLRRIESIKKFQLDDSENFDFDNEPGNSKDLAQADCEKSYFLFSKTNPVRQVFFKVSSSRFFSNFMISLIIINCLKLVADTYYLNSPDTSIEAQISTALDVVFTISFNIEFVVKSISLGFCMTPKSYIRDNWNKLDFTIVVLSTLDLSMKSINIPAVKVIRILRTLRPLKLIKHNISLKIVVRALFESITAILNVMILILVVWVIFAILGVSLLSGKMHKCSNPAITDMVSCISNGKEWAPQRFNFDNVLQAIVVLFIVMSQESWPDRMLEAVDAKGVGLAPAVNSSPGMAYFYMAYLFISNFYLLNLFTVVIFNKFTEARKSESSLSSLLLSKEQVLWTEVQNLLLKAKPWESKKKQLSGFRFFFYRLSKSRLFEIIMTGVIVINVMSMALEYAEAPVWYVDALDLINLICTFAFMAEAAIKLIGLDLHYFKSKWNRFDFTIVIFSIADVVLSNLSFINAPFLRQGPQLARVLRVIRVLRLFRLVKSLETLEKIVKIMGYTLPALLNVLSLILLIYFMYGVLGCFLYHDVPANIGITDWYNFSNFHSSLSILWRISTGEDYPNIMADTVIAQQNYFNILYFFSFVMIIDFVILELFVSITLQYFEEFYMNPFNSVDLFSEDLKKFKVAWVDVATDSFYKIDKEGLISLVEKLGLEFNMLKENCRFNVVKLIGAMDVYCDSSEKYYFNDVLYSILRRKYEKKINKRENKLDFTIMRMEELKTKKALKELRAHFDLKYKREGGIKGEQKGISPFSSGFYEFFYIRSVFNGWKRYSKNAIEYNRQLTPEISDTEYIN